MMEASQPSSAAFNYVVTAHKPTAVAHSAVGHFTGPEDLNLIISYVNTPNYTFIYDSRV